MGFLYKHYEKIVLAVFLLVFVGALVYLIHVFSQSKDISEVDLQIKPEGEDYSRIFDDKGKEKVAVGTEGKYSLKENLNNRKLWVHSKKRDTNSIASTDFMVPFPAARCKICKRVIPKVSFVNKICPLCEKNPGPIKKPPKINEKLDTDKDGIPDIFEKKITGMDFENPKDRWTDLDEDGYVNFVEFKAKTDLNDPKSHPPLAERLALYGLGRKQLRIKLVNVDKRDSDNKKDWEISIKVINKRGRESIEFKKLGESFKPDNRKADVYKIIDVEYKVVEEFDKSIGQPMDVNKSEIVIQNIVKNNENPIKVVRGQKVYENKAEVGIKDTVTDKRYRMREGDKFIVGDENVGTEEYTIISVDFKKKEVKIQDLDKEQYTIGRKSKLQEITETEQTKGSSPEESGDENINTQEGRTPSSTGSPKNAEPIYKL